MFTSAVIDLGSELLIDRTKIRIPQLELLLAAIGQPLARGSAWVAVNKQVALLYPLPWELIGGTAGRGAAA